MGGLSGIRALSGLTGLVGGADYVDFSLAETTFTARMAKRQGKNAYSGGAGPIYQGPRAGGGTPDILSYGRGNQLGNAAQDWYDNFDPYQFFWTAWVTPEWEAAGSHRASPNCDPFPFIGY